MFSQPYLSFPTALNGASVGLTPWFQQLSAILPNLVAVANLLGQSKR